MTTVQWLLVLVLGFPLGLVALAVSVYVLVKMATLGYLVARKQFRRRERREGD